MQTGGCPIGLRSAESQDNDFSKRLGGDGMSLVSRCALVGWLTVSFVAVECSGLQQVAGAEISTGSGVTTANFVVEGSAEPQPGVVLQAESEKLFGKEPASPAIQRVNSTKSEEGADIAKGSSSSRVRAQAVENLPLKNLNQDQRARVHKIVKDAGLFRRLPTVVFPSEAECYGYFLEYPESAVSIWRAMGISELQLQGTGPNLYTGDAGDGTVGRIEVLFRDSDTVLVICEGEYKSPFLKKPIVAQSVLNLETNYFRETDDKVYITHRADLFVTFPSQTVETVAKVLAPLTVPIADRSFVEVSMFLKMMSMAMERRPDWIQEMANRMDGIPEDRKTRLLSVADEINSRAESRVSLSAHRTPQAIPFSQNGVSQIPAISVSSPTERAAHPERTSQTLRVRK